MEIKKTGAKFKENETRLGVYVWEMPDGRWIGDDDGNFLFRFKYAEFQPADAGR